MQLHTTCSVNVGGKPVPALMAGQKRFVSIVADGVARATVVAPPMRGYADFLRYPRDHMRLGGPAAVVKFVICLLYISILCAQLLVFLTKTLQLAFVAAALIQKRFASALKLSKLVRLHHVLPKQIHKQSRNTA